MTGKWLRRTLMLAAGASLAVLSACSSSTIESALRPARFISFGDALSDVGQSGTRYTVNDSSVNIWAQQLATSYGLTLTNAASGGTGYARAHARVVNRPDAAGSTTTPTIKEQIDQFLGSGTFGANDVVVINGGLSDMVVNFASFTTEAALVSASQQAGSDLAAQVRRLVTAGAKYVVVSGLYDLSKSPWGKASGQTSALSNASQKFNEALLVAINDLGANVLYIDAAYYFNLVTAAPSGYGLTNSTDIACTSVDSGAGIGIGTGQVSSGLCTTSTLASGIDYSKYVFADKLYFTPVTHRLYGTYAYDRLRTRW